MSSKQTKKSKWGKDKMRAGSPECSILEELLRGSYEPEELGNLGSTVGWYSVANKRGKTLTRFTRESFTNVARQLIKKILNQAPKTTSAGGIPHDEDVIGMENLNLESDEESNSNKEDKKEEGQEIDARIKLPVYCQVITTYKPGEKLRRKYLHVIMHLISGVSTLAVQNDLYDCNLVQDGTALKMEFSNESALSSVLFDADILLKGLDTKIPSGLNKALKDEILEKTRNMNHIPKWGFTWNLPNEFVGRRIEHHGRCQHHVHTSALRQAGMSRNDSLFSFQVTVLLDWEDEEAKESKDIYRADI